MNTQTLIRAGWMTAAVGVAALWVLSGLALAQNPAPEVPQTREEKIRAHRERIRQIIQERREQQQKDSTPPAAGPSGAAPAESDIQERPQPPGAEPQQPQEAAGSPSASNIKINNCMLYLKPLDLIATQGERFSSRVVLDNPSGVNVGEVSIVLRYDPRVVSCVRVFDDQFRPYTIAPPEFEDLPVKGMLVYSAALKQPRPLPKTTVLTVIWEALRSTDFSEIEFDFSDEGPTTFITFNRQDVLGLPGDPYDGVINASLLIRKKAAPTLAQTDAFTINRKEVIDFFKGIDNPPGSVFLDLEPPSKPVQVGDTIDIPIYFHNPNALTFDTLSVFIQFNPDELQVVDWDKGNWIRRGVNIHDGDAHDTFPFDYLVCNEALNSVGSIDYRVGLQRPRALPSGRIATVRFRAKTPSTGTTIRFVAMPKGEKRTTRVSLHDENLLDLAGDLSNRQIRFAIFP